MGLLGLEEVVFRVVELDGPCFVLMRGYGREVVLFVGHLRLE